MKSEWQTKKIGEVVDIRRGSSPRPIHKFLATEGMPWVKIADATSDTSRYIWKTNEFIIEDGVTKSVKVAPETLIVSNSATPGLPKIMKITACVHDGWLVFSNYRGITRDFLYYKFIDIRRTLVNQANGSVFQNLKTDIVKDFDIDIPCIETQKKIVEILSQIDEKIELNNAINNNLFEQMQALYKAWFVDFEPFGGVRPSNWNDTNIYAIANIIYGAPFASKLFNTDGLGKPIIRIRDLKEQAFVTFTTEEHPKGHLIQPGDIVVGMDGEFRPYIWGNEPAWLNQRVCIFESNRPQGKAFVLYTIKPLLNKIEQTQVATTVIHIGKKDFDAFEIILPDEATLDSFDSITAPMIEQIVNNRLQNKRLAVLRDTLLPKLMSGELDVSNIEL